MTTSSIIRASVLQKQKVLQTADREIPDPQFDEVQVEVKATTLCGSDLHYYNHGANGDFKVREPLSLGHESAGVVVSVGSSVSSLKPGDKVALEVGKPCGECKNCRTGRYNLCGDMKFRSSAKTFPHLQGTLQERINCPATWCHKLPDNVSLEQGALVEPLAVAVHAANRASIKPGSSVLILGAGAIGLFSAAMAKISGATTIVMADIAQNRLDFAKENGLATHTYVVPLKKCETTEQKLSYAKDLASELNALDNDQFDYTFECTGVESCVQAGIYATAAGGKLLFLGMGNPVLTLHVAAAALREVDLVGVMRYANSYATGIKLISRGLIPALDKIITHRVKGLDNAQQAFELAGKPEDKDGNLVIKVAVVL